MEVPLAEHHTKLSLVCADHCDVPCVRSWGCQRNSEEPQSLFLLLHCSALLSYALTSCIVVQVVESQLWVPAGLGAVPILGLSQQSTSACIKTSCKSRGTSLCPSTLPTCDFIVIRKENWDALNPILILFSHLNRVCIIWSIRMDFCLEEREACMYVRACVCVWELCRFLFGFSSFTKIARRVALLWMERPFGASATHSHCLPISISFSWKVKLKHVPFSTAVLVKLHFWHQWKELDDCSDGVGTWMWGKVLYKQRPLADIILVIWKSMWNKLVGSKTSCNVYVQLNLTASYVGCVRIINQQMLTRSWNGRG